MQLDYSTKLLGLEEFWVENFEVLEKGCIFWISKKTNFEICPVCHHPTDKIHDRRKQKIKDIPIRGKPAILILLKRRFRCKVCFNVFLEHYESINLYSRKTMRFGRYLYGQKRYPFKWVAEDNFVSEQVVARNFNLMAEKELAQRKPRIITALGIDENSFRRGSKYNTVITNLLGTPKVLEILPGKKKKILDEFLANLPYRGLIRYVVIDMCKMFFKSVKKHCAEADIIIDKFHVLSHITRVLSSIRKKKLYEPLGITITRKMIMKPYEQLNLKEKKAIDFLLQDNTRFREVYEFKERFSRFYRIEEMESAEIELLELIAIAMQSDIPKLVDFGRLLMRWGLYILNYFICKITNGFTEGINNKVKLIKRMSYGFRNFENFRKKVLVNFE